MCERAINLPKFNTPQTHHQDNNITIALPVRPKQLPDVHSRARALSRGDLVSRRNKGSHRTFDMYAGEPSWRRF